MDDLRDLLKEYWPIVAGVFAVILTAILVWPSSDQEPREPVEGIFEAAEPLTEKAARDLEMQRRREEIAEEAKRAKEAIDEQADAPAAPPSTSDELQMLEIVNAVPIEVPAEPAAPRSYATDDPEVKEALGKVQVVLYEEDNCDACRQARRYLEKNDVPLSVVNVQEDSNQRERARRLSGTRSLPVIVVDGRTLTEFSEPSVQSALTAAVKKRVEAKN